MDFVARYKGVVGHVFGNNANENSSSNEDSYVECMLDRISNGKLAEGRRNAIIELQAVVSESQAAQLAFGAMGFPVMLGVLKEERDDVEMVRGALETLVGALIPINHSKGPSKEVQPALMNTDLLSRESESISLLLSLLVEDDFYVRYYTLQLLTALITNSPQRLQEAILTIPRGITQLMDLLMDREVIRNEALLLLTHLTREAEEIQKIVVFEGAFEKIFSIIKEEGGADGGVIVQDCLGLLNNVVRNSVSNQILLREAIGFDLLITILKLRGNTYTLTQQKTINLLSALETIRLLMNGGSEADPGKDKNKQTNKATLVQALRCIGDLVAGDSNNLAALGNKFLGEEPQVEPALNSILRIILQTSSVLEFIAADYVFKCFCEKNADGQAMLASTLIPQPYSANHPPIEEDVKMSFGSMLLHGLTFGENYGDLEICCRAASVLSHVLKDNLHCKERVLQIEIEAPMPSLGDPEPLMHQMVKYSVFVSSMKSKDGKRGTLENSYDQVIILKLLVTWLADCPSAVECFLDAPFHITHLLGLVSNSSATACVRGLAAVILGECVIYNTSSDNGKDTFGIVDTIIQKVGLSSYFLKFDEMQRSFFFTSAGSTQMGKSFSRSSAASMADIDDVDENDLLGQENLDHPILSSILDSYFVKLVKILEADIRQQIMEVFNHPKVMVAVVPAELKQKSSESDGEYIKRLKAFVENKCSEIQDLLVRNTTLAEDLAKTGGGGNSLSDHIGSVSSDKSRIETLRRDLQEAYHRLEILKTEKVEVQSKATAYQNVTEKLEADLRSLFDAYNSLEQSNLQLEKDVKTLKNGVSLPLPDVEAIKAKVREEVQNETEAELNDLLVCLGQEQSKVERLSARLSELGEDVDKLLEGIEDDIWDPEEREDEEDSD